MQALDTPIYLQELNLLQTLTARIPVAPVEPKSCLRYSAALHFFSLSAKYYNDESATLAYASSRRT